MLKVILVLTLLQGIILCYSTFECIQSPSRIVGGEPAKIGQFPFQVSIQVSYNTNNRTLFSHICAGSILNKNWILTAAQCVQFESARRTHLIVGAHRSSEGKKYRAAKFIAHPEYVGFEEYYDHDIALIRTREDIEFNERVKPIELSSIFAREETAVRVSGWAFHHDDIVNSTTHHLRYINITTLRNQDCRGYFNDVDAQFVHNNTVCTDNLESQSVCVSNKGAGLFDIAENNLIGVYSWTISCGQGNPDGFTRVAPYLNWINEKTGIVF